MNKCLNNIHLQRPSPSNISLCLYRFLAERNAEKQASGVYVFSDMNPYVGYPDPMKEGQELFRKGLLSEAALALEAEVMKKILRMLKVGDCLGSHTQRTMMINRLTLINLHEPLITLDL